MDIDDMDMDDETRQALFNQLLRQAIEVPTLEREPFLRSICDDGPLRLEVLDALNHQEDLGEFLESPCAGFAAMASTMLGRPSGPEGSVPVTVDAFSGTLSRIGPYKILEELGSGGMGRVFLAQQARPIRRRVAVKLIKTSLVGREASVRFSAERQAMARLGHDNVARIHDGGTTDDGYPFFVMEYVPGLPITEYCDRESLNLKQRLRLFIEVCDGVQHAHLNQILHRDLKPANILVSEVDGKPVVKVIDFGIAKALDQPLTEESLVTGEKVLGTPAYMSPEAFEGRESRAVRVDARTDVYSIGILLYELLAGVGPYDPRKGLAVMFDKIRQGDPPKPSRRISSMSADRLSRVADHRRVEPEELARRLSGDLDWIVHKAIAREPDDRYGSASELAAEIGRFLADEPVLAGPRTLRYRCGKLVCRHRLALAAAAVVAVALLMGIAGITYGLFRARHEAEVSGRARIEEEQARRETEEVARFLVGLFEVSDPAHARGREVTARELLERGAERIRGELDAQPMLRARMMATLGQVHKKLGLYQQSLPLLEEALELRRRRTDDGVSLALVENLVGLGEAYRQLGRLDDAESLINEGLVLETELLGAPGVETLHQLASVHMSRGEFQRSEVLLLRARSVAEQIHGPDSLEMARVAAALGACYAYQARFAKAEPFTQQALEIRQARLGPMHPLVAANLNSLALMASNAGRVAAAEELFRRCLTIYESVVGEEHPEVRKVLGNLGYTLFQAGRHAEALPHLERAAKLDRALHSVDNLSTTSRMTNLGLVYWKLGRLDEAEPLFRKATEIRDRILDPAHPHRATSLWGLANVYRDQGRLNEAEILYRQALEIRRNALQPGSRELRQAREEYAVLLRSMGRLAEAKELDRKPSVQLAVLE